MKSDTISIIECSLREIKFTDRKLENEIIVLREVVARKLTPLISFTVRVSNDRSVYLNDGMGCMLVVLVVLVLLVLAVVGVMLMMRRMMTATDNDKVDGNFDEDHCGSDKGGNEDNEHDNEDDVDDDVVKVLEERKERGIMNVVVVSTFTVTMAGLAGLKRDASPLFKIPFPMTVAIVICLRSLWVWLLMLLLSLALFNL